MHLAFGSDHTAMALKEELMAYATSLGHTCEDVGLTKGTMGDYPTFGALAARMVKAGQCQLGIVLCGTGIGISLSANKIKGIRCAPCGDCYTAMMARAHNDANMLALGARVIGPELAKMILKAFLETPFEGGRHQRRVDMITALEEEKDTP